MLCSISLGGLRILLETALPFKTEAEFLPFLEEADAPEVRVRLLPDPSVRDWQVTFSKDGSALETRYHPSRQRELATLRGCLMYVPMEELLLRHGRMLLHSALVSTPEGGLLFSGDSGCGKSTQAELWRTHRGGEVLNGDRAILARTGDGWQGYGSPYAGSSGIFRQACCPIRAIVLPEQAGENLARRISEAEAFKRLFLQVGADHSRPETVEAVCDLLTALVEKVPVYRLCCTADSRAVEALERTLQKEGV